MIIMILAILLSYMHQALSVAINLISRLNIICLVGMLVDVHANTDGITYCYECDKSFISLLQVQDHMLCS
jgi:hypothetical protein